MAISKFDDVAKLVRFALKTLFCVDKTPKLNKVLVNNGTFIVSEPLSYKLHISILQVRPVDVILLGVLRAWELR